MIMRMKKFYSLPTLESTFASRTKLTHDQNLQKSFQVPTPKKRNFKKCPTARVEKNEIYCQRTKKYDRTTMCIIHKGFRGFRAVSPASILGGNLLGLKPAIPYEIIHSPLAFIKIKIWWNPKNLTSRNN
jgi:hypothetical protein